MHTHVYIYIYYTSSIGNRNALQSDPLHEISAVSPSNSGSDALRAGSSTVRLLSSKESGAAADEFRGAERWGRGWRRGRVALQNRYLW